MKNLLRAIALSLSFYYPQNTIGQYDLFPIPTIHYGVDPKLHARGIAVDRKNIYIAASDSRLYLYNDKTREVYRREFPIQAELRDVEISRKHIILLASGDSSSTISIDRKTYENTFNHYPGIFLDGISLKKNYLFMMGDPIHGSFSLFESHNGGISWKTLDNLPHANKGEAGFAASGTNVQMISKKDLYFVSGGMDSKLYQSHDAGRTWSSSDMGFKSCESCGAYSFVILPDNKTFVAVGGDYMKPTEGTGSCRISNDKGLTWYSPKQDVGGYRSNVLYYKGDLFACGTNGIDISSDFGETWTQFTIGNYYTMAIFKKRLIASTTYGGISFFDLKKYKKNKK